MKTIFFDETLSDENHEQSLLWLLLEWTVIEVTGLFFFHVIISYLLHRMLLPRPRSTRQARSRFPLWSSLSASTPASWPTPAILLLAPLSMTPSRAPSAMISSSCRRACARAQSPRPTTTWCTTLTRPSIPSAYKDWRTSCATCTTIGRWVNCTYSFFFDQTKWRCVNSTILHLLYVWINYTHLNGYVKNYCKMW